MSTNNRGTRYDEDYKRTLVNLYQPDSKTKATLCREYIEGFYNSKRPHGTFGMLTRNQKETLFWNQA